MFCSIQEHKESYFPPPCEAEVREQLGMSEECKFILFKSQLMLLIKLSHVCGQDRELKVSFKGHYW